MLSLSQHMHSMFVFVYVCIKSQVINCLQQLNKSIKISSRSCGGNDYDITEKLSKFFFRILKSSRFMTFWNSLKKNN